MFRLKVPGLELPPLYEHVERKLATIDDKGWDKVGDFILRDGIDLIPQVGMQEDICRCTSNLIFACGQATSGKCAPLDSHVLTPRGFVRMGDLKVGDTITGRDGKPQTVIEIYEQPDKEMFQFTMRDGAVVETSAEHLWLVSESRWKRESRTCLKTTEEIIRDFEQTKQKPHYAYVRNIKFPLNGAVEFNQRAELKIWPYILGAIIGDGCTRFGWNRVGITSKDQYILDRFSSAGYNLYQVKGSAPYGYFISDKKLCDNLREYGLFNCLSYDKFIPEDYKYASIDDRRELIRGLFDTDGSCSRSGIEYSTTSKRLADDVMFILRSLGYLCKCSSRVTSFTHKGEKKTGRKSYRITVYADDASLLFGLERKFSGHKPNEYRHGFADAHYLKDIKPVGVKPCRCILVSNPDHLYIMDDFIVTHNSFGIFLKGLQGVSIPNYTGRLINVRKLDSAKGTSMFRDASLVWGQFAGCEVSTGELPTFVWPEWNNSIQMIHANFNADNPSEWQDFIEYIKKQQASFIGIDEATAIRQFKMFTYIFSRNRDSSGVTPQMLLTFNPEYGHWTTEWLLCGGYINPETWHIRPEMRGKERYFYIQGNSPESVVWGDSREEVVEAAHIKLNAEDYAAGLTPASMVKSFTLLTGPATGNRKLVAATHGQSVANLHNVGGDQRAVLAEEYFGPIDNEELNVNKQMIRDLATNPYDDDETLYGTMDVSGGGVDSDDNPFIAWKGHTIVGLEFFRGDPRELVEWIAQVLQKYGIPKKNFAFDATGLGNYLRAYTEGWPVTANKTAMQEYDTEGNAVTFEQYFNLRSQLMSKLEVALKTGKISTSLDLYMTIPYGKKGMTRRLIDVLFDEINTFRTLQRNKRIYYRSKDEYRAKFHASPNIIDTMYLRMVWDLDSRPKKAPAPEIEDDAYDGLYNDYASGRSIIWV